MPESVYGPSRACADDLLERLGAHVDYYPPLTGGAIGSRIRDNTRLIACRRASFSLG